MGQNSYTNAESGGQPRSSFLWETGESGDIHMCQNKS